MKDYIVNILTFFSIFAFVMIWKTDYVFPFEEIKIIERGDVTKRLKLMKLVQDRNGKLSNYSTFSFYVKERLIFCHLSNDRSEPRVICH